MRVRRIKSNKRDCKSEHAGLRSNTIVELAERRRLLAPCMQREQIGSADVLPFRLKSLDHLRPMLRRNAFPPPPLRDSPVTFTHVGGHLDDRIPAVENISKVSHTPYCAGDELSRQAGAAFPVRKGGSPRENSRMGRARSPIQFNKDLASRLRAARIASGQENARKFAELLGVEYERYKKWESGRTPIQHEYLPRACELTGKDANYFYGLRADPEREAS